MKKIAYGLLLLFLGSNLSAQDIDWDAVVDRYYEKYQPSENPQWVFPIIFKNGLGKQDTIYKVIDEGADTAVPWPQDIVYGEEYETVDSFSFNAWWNKCPSAVCNDLSITKINASNFGGGSIRFFNGIKPITMYFNPEFFYTDSLPTPYYEPPNPSEPAARGSIQLSDFDSTLPTPSMPVSCNWVYADIWLSDSIPPTTQVGCHFSDSLILQYETDSPYADVIFLSIVDWSPTSTSTEEVNFLTDFKINPNPSIGTIFISSDSYLGEPLQLILFDIQGRKLMQKAINFFNGKLELDLSNWSNGLYMLQINTSKNKSFHKISLQR